MIQPTVGRVVWFYPGKHDLGIGSEPGKPLAAVVVHVWTDRMVNLAVFDRNGLHHARTSVPLKQDGDEIAPGNAYCDWMPYQKGQAAKAEALEKELAGKA